MIKREIIKVPKGIRYLSDWKDFSLVNFPDICVIDKKLPGCGFTNYCLTSPENIVLCSPRKILIKNKAEQHGDKVYLVINQLEREIEVDKDLSENIENKNPQFIQRVDIDIVIPEKDKQDLYSRLKSEISNYIIQMINIGKPYKILVTYDSYRIVRSILEELSITNYRTVVDEMQALISDAPFKPNVEVDFFEELKKSKRVYFVSATPILEEYMNMLEEFDNMPYFELDWISEDISRIIKPDLKIRTMKSTGYTMRLIIESYKRGEFEKVPRKNKNGDIEFLESKEAVFYVNSVNEIFNIIKKCNLLPEEVNILCADNDKNIKKMKNKLGKNFSIGSVPLKGEKHKMFTFCTRTVYIGADFYSDCARTFVFSDSNIECLAVDIKEDLPQILGRQRNDKNPWSNSATLYYISFSKGNSKKTTKEELDRFIDNKVKATETMLTTYNKLKDVYQEGANKYVKDVKYLAKVRNYKEDYTAVKSGIPALNKFVLVNELRAFRIQQMDYNDFVSVFATASSTFDLDTDNINSQEVLKFMKNYRSKTTFYDKLKMLCTSKLNSEELSIVLNQIPNSDSIKSSYVILGSDRCRSLSYNKTFITKELEKITTDYSDMVQEILNLFIVGEDYTISDIRGNLKSVYMRYKPSEEPVATDLEKYFEVNYHTKVLKDNTGKKKRVRVIKIIKKKLL